MLSRPCCGRGRLAGPATAVKLLWLSLVCGVWAWAVLQVEKSSDDTVKLKILQTALTLLQNPHNVDDKVCQHSQQLKQLWVLAAKCLQRTVAGTVCQQ